MAEAFILLFARFPILGGLFGFIFAAAFSVTGIASWLDLQASSSAPLQLPLQQALTNLAQRDYLWVDLVDVRWDCRNIISSQVGSEVRTEILFTDAKQTVFGIAQFSEGTALNCTQIQGKRPVGFLRLMTPTFLQRLPQRGFNLVTYAQIPNRVTLCTFCSRSNSILLVILSLIFVPMGLCMYPLCKRLQQHYRTKGIL